MNFKSRKVGAWAVGAGLITVLILMFSGSYPSLNASINARLLPNGNNIAQVVAPGQFVYVANGPNYHDALYRKEANTFTASALIREFSYRETITNPSWSFDSSQIAFTNTVRSAQGAVIQAIGVFKINVDGTQLVQLTNPCPSIDVYCEFIELGTAWSPDGQFIAFLHFQRAGDMLFGSLRIIPSIGGQDRILDTFSMSVSALSDWEGLNWSADGTFIVYRKNRSLAKIPVSSNGQSGSPVTLRSPIGAYDQFFHPSIATDSMQIAYVYYYYSLTNPTYEIRVMNQIGEESGINLFSGIFPSWSPNGLELGYDSFTLPGLRAREVITGVEREIVPQVALFSYPVWSRDIVPSTPTPTITPSATSGGRNTMPPPGTPCSIA